MVSGRIVHGELGFTCLVYFKGELQFRPAPAAFPLVVENEYLAKR